MVLAVLVSLIHVWPPLPSRFVGQPAIAEVGRNGSAVAAFDAGTAALQPRQPSVVALVPPIGLTGNRAKRYGDRD